MALGCYLMVSDGGLIAMSLISLAGMVLLFTLNNSMWFKKQNFKVDIFNVKAQNKLNLRKMEKDMGLTTSKASVINEAAPASPLGGIDKLLPLLKNLDSDQLGGLLEAYTGLTAEEGAEGTMLDTLLGYAEEHPDTVKGLLDGLTAGGGDGAESQEAYQV